MPKITVEIFTFVGVTKRALMIFGKSTLFHIYNVKKFEHVDEKYNLVKQGLLLWKRKGP